MVKAKGTRKNSKTVKAEVLMVDSASKIPELEKLLKEGKLTVVLVYADWCGACTKFKKDIWGPMCKQDAIHNRAAVRDDLLSNTSLKKTKFNYLPSVLVVDEKGTPQLFEGPEGTTNAMPTPKSLTEMNRIVNIPVKPLESLTTEEKPIPEYLKNGESTMKAPEYHAMNPLLSSLSTIEPLKSPVAQATPEGSAFEPMAVPQKGGALGTSRLMRFLKGVANGHIPISSLVPAGKRKSRKHRKQSKKRRQTKRR